MKRFREWHWVEGQQRTFYIFEGFLVLTSPFTIMTHTHTYIYSSTPHIIYIHKGGLGSFQTDQIY